jgi:hypothetical protein
VSDTYRPPEGAAVAAKRALRWLEEGKAGGGFTDVGRRRASQLANREALSLETVKRMYSFFSRHEVDKQGKDFNNTDDPSPGRVAWDAWGGDAGYSWAKRIAESAKEKNVNATASVFARIVKTDKQPDGTLLVSGVASDSSLDSDEQVCDPTWLKSAMPTWFRWGNIREQHSNIAAGVATEYEDKDGEHWVTARVVDPSSVKKVEAGVLKGFSIGIRSPRVVRDAKAAGGRIVDGEIVEVSLVDRPANPACTISLAKTLDGVTMQTEELHEKADAESTSEESTETSSAPSEESTATKKAMCKGCGEPSEKCKCDEGGFERKATEESSQQVGEESSQEIGEESSRPGGIAGVAGKACPVCESKLAEMHDIVSKMYGIMQKSVGEDIGKAMEDIADRVSKMEKTAATTAAPVRMNVHTDAPVKNDAAATKAAVYREKAMKTSDPTLAQGYLALAVDLEKSL